MSTTNQRSGTEIQVLTENLANRNTEHEKLEIFKQDLQKTYED